MAKQLGQETRSIAKIGEPIEKLQLLRGLGAEDWDLDVIPANRQRLLAQYVRHATSQAIGRRDPAFRHPALLAFCADAAARITDEIVDLLDDGVAAQHAKARRALVQQKLDVADSANASVVLLKELLEILLERRERADPVPHQPDPLLDALVQAVTRAASAGSSAVSSSAVAPAMSARCQRW